MDNHFTVKVNNNDKDYIVDKEGMELFEKYSWFSTSGDYPYLRAKANSDGRSIVLKFHIELMKNEILEILKDSPNTKVVIDHMNGNVYDNRKCNLRMVTQSENNMNKTIQSNNSSGIVGVSWSLKSRMWMAYITVNKKRKNLGHFYYFRNAVKARVDAEDLYFGEHAFRHRDEDYKTVIDAILSMEHKTEPIFTPKKTKYEVNGISEYKKDRFKLRFFYGGEEVFNRICDDLDSAIACRIEKEIEYYGQPLTFAEYKKDKEL